MARTLRTPATLCCALTGAGCLAVTPAPLASRADRPHAIPTAAPALPQEGDRVFDVRTYYGIPILQKSFFWDGNGEDDEFGLKVRSLWHATDRFAIGAGVTASVWPKGKDRLAGELETVGRYYVYRASDFGSFLELAGGYVHSTDPVPVGGTEWNFTFSFGGGIDVPLQQNLDLMAGATYHHISNALGRQNRRNPSQNEAQIWLGFAVRF